MASVWIPSTVNGKTWQCSVFRTFSGEIVASANEGETDSHGLFTFAPFSNRSVRIKLDAKRLTEKVATQGFAQLRAKLIEDKLILNQD